MLREPEGGINTYRSRFAVSEPMRMHTTVGNRIDEVGALRALPRAARHPTRPRDGLRILLVGELAYNADRVLALEERGHRLFGLWMPDPYWYNTVGPLPFGHVDGPPAPAAGGTPSADAGIDVIYALLNWQAVPFAASVLRADPASRSSGTTRKGRSSASKAGHWGELPS